jgi:hypothetical protein
MDENSDWPHYRIDHPSGWTAKTHGGPYIDIGHQATPGVDHDVINASNDDPGDTYHSHPMHPAFTKGTPEENHNALARALSEWVGESGEDTARANPKIKQWQEMHGMTNQAMKKHAHDSGDGETIYHCPFCGSGQVIARSDRTIECEFCHTCFTVQVQPEFSAFPQTIDGQPVQVPGMPGQIGEDPNAPPEAPPGDQQPGDEGAIPPQAGNDGSIPADEGDSPSGDDSTGGNPFTSSRKAAPFGQQFFTASGKRLPVEDYLAHLVVVTSEETP